MKTVGPLVIGLSAILSFAFLSASPTYADGNTNHIAKPLPMSASLTHADNNTNQVAKPTLPIWEASKLAQEELEKRGLAESHVISSVSYYQGYGTNRPACYRVAFRPPLLREVPAISTNDSPPRFVIEFQIDMQGKVTEEFGRSPMAVYRSPQIVTNQTGIIVTNKWPTANAGGTNAASPTSLRRRILRQSLGTQEPGTVGSNEAPAVKVLKGDGDQPQLEFQQNSSGSTNDGPIAQRRRVLREKIRSTNEVDRLAEPVLKPATNKPPASTSGTP